ncbi:MAG: hypothetical protein HC836_45310 [Richelia sp. RM2_1_2]|nr:hypothetical protein [Richelia sp. RM2_1_2]
MEFKNKEISKQKLEKLRLVYEKYIKEAMNIKDIKRWSSRKTLSNTTYSSERTNETKIIDAIKNSDYTVGDRVWLFFKEDGSLELVENYDGNYDKLVLIKKIFQTSKLFSSVLDTDMLYCNYSLKKNQGKLKELCQTK